MSKQITNCIINKSTTSNPIWLMRQAGRYLPEFREIRKKNPNFIKLCLNSNLATEITLQPIKRFDFDGGIIFSDILMLPYGINQKVEFKKGFGPKLETLQLDNIKNTSEIDFTKKIQQVYEAISKTSSDPIMVNKDMIGFSIKIIELDLLIYLKNKSCVSFEVQISIKWNFCSLRILIGSILFKFLDYTLANRRYIACTLKNKDSIFN